VWLVYSLALIMLVGCREPEANPSVSDAALIDQPAVTPTDSLPATFTPQAIESAGNPATGDEFECRENAECVLVLRTNSCCSCPEVMGQTSLLTGDPLVLYEPGQSYGDLLPERCANVACETCLPPPIPICGDDGRCRALSSPEIILQECPDCYEQAAIAAFKNGDTTQAISYCYQVDVDACLLALFSEAIAGGNHESALQLCNEPAHPDPGGCLATVAPALAGENSQRAIDLCLQIATTDVRQFGCMLDVAITVYATDPEGGLAICTLLSGERVNQCLQEVEAKP